MNKRTGENTCRLLLFKTPQEGRWFSTFLSGDLSGNDFVGDPMCDDLVGDALESERDAGDLGSLTVGHSLRPVDDSGLTISAGLAGEVIFSGDDARLFPPTDGLNGMFTERPLPK